MKNNLFRIIQAGSDKSYDLWETQLVTKMNRIALLGAFNMVLGIIFFLLIDSTQFIVDCVFSLVALSLTIILNKYTHYIFGIYCFYICGFLFFISINLKMGRESYVILFYVPVIISMFQLIGRRQLLKHLIVLSVVCLLSIIAIAIGFKYRFMQTELSDSLIANLFIFNIILSFFTILGFSLIMVNDYIKQDETIKKMLSDKEILLAEVFHRVKNNLNIVTSLLNLKKNNSSSEEVKEALEECRARVFSMALVHQNIYNSDEVALNFKEYIENLIFDIGNSLGTKDNIDIQLEMEKVILDLTSAIPCGLILNEVLTNAYKYAKLDDRQLHIHVLMKVHNGNLELEIHDNGPGMPETILKEENSLGMELIKSLTEQLNGSYSFHNDEGTVFRLKFQLKS